MVTIRRIFVSFCGSGIALLCFAGLQSALAQGPFDSADVPPDDSPLTITRITPEGVEVRASSQIVFTFDRNVVPIGRMEREASEIPIEITPAVNCAWRWLNSRALACQLSSQERLKPATHYLIKVKPGIKTESGVTMAEMKGHSFITERPKVNYASFVHWLSPSKPLIQITFNQSVVRSSVEKLFSFGGLSSSDVAAEVMPDEMGRTLPAWAGGGYSQNTKPDNQTKQVGSEEARRIWLLMPQRELGLNEDVLLKIAPGLVSADGPMTGTEDRVVVTFRTFPEFEFLGVECRPVGGRNWILIDKARMHSNVDIKSIENNTSELCIPNTSAALVFSAPVKNSIVRDHVQFDPRLDGGRTDYNPWANVRDSISLNYPHRANAQYKVWIPENLKAYEKYSLVFALSSFEDEFGRKLNPGAASNYSFFTDHRPASFWTPNPNTVLEKNIDSDVGAYVTNINKITANYATVRSDSTKNTNGTHSIPVPEVEDVTFLSPLQIREMLENESGVVYGKINATSNYSFDHASNVYGREKDFFAQVTPYQVHAKIGHFNSLVWVTELSTGKPVSNAKVSLLRGYYKSLQNASKEMVEGTSNHDGIATLPGFIAFDPNLNVFNSNYGDNIRFFVKVVKENDIAVLPLDYSYGTSHGWHRPEYRHMKAWGTTAQGVYKLGDSIKYKIYVRDQSNEHWVSPKKESYQLRIHDPLGKLLHEQKDVTLNEFGAMDGEFKLPEQGAVGWYDFRLSSNFTGMSWSPLKVLVTDFTPAPFKVETEHLGKRFKAGDKVNIRASASMFAGGPYANAKIRLTSTLRSAGFHNTNQSFKKFHFGYFNASGTRTLLNRNATLNNEGEITESFVLPDSLNFYVGTIDTEAAVTDDRGKSVASMASTKFVGRDRFVGLRNTQWVYNAGEKATFEAVVLDDESQIVTNVPIHVKVKYQETVISRVKGPGNAYLSRYTHNWIDVHECKISSEKGAVRCTFVPEKPGSYQFQASVNDSKGRSHQSTITAWVTGSGFVNWAQENNDNLEIIAEETSLTIGQTANYLVKNPFPGAMALVTIERYGVLKSWVQELKTGTPLISFEVLPDYLPGFYLSVTVMSPRVDKPLENGKVDLGKPTYRMGYVSSSVVDPYKTLDVKVKTDSETYQPRSQVKASIEVSSKEARNKRFEIAVAVVDESVLALNKERKSYYDPYAGFNHLDNLDLKNYSLISQLLGRQRFEKKGVDSGGDGDPGVAPSALRNLFKYVTYWNPSIVPDSDGKANIDFVVPDNLTGWRVLAWAVTPDDFMGLGDSNFKVSKHTEIRPVMPNQLVEGDSFKAGFSVMNRTDKTRTIQTFLQVVGPLEKGTNTTQNKVITLKPFEKQIVWMPLKTRGDGVLRFMAGAGDNSSSDRMEHQLVVNKRRSLETAATYGTTEKEKVSESVHIPENIYTDVGEVSVTLSPTVIGNIDGAFEYVKDYPYFCWEQRLTKAVMASNNKILSDYLKKETRWENPDAMVQDHLDRAASYQAPNGGMAFWIGRNDYVSPYLSAYTAIAFNWLRQAGYRIPETVESRLHEYLQTMIRKDVFPDFYSKGMASSVRAVALAALAEHNKAMGQDTKRYMEHLQEMDLFGRSFLLSAAIRTNLNKDAIDSVLNSILGSANQTGGKFQFLEMLDDSYKTMLATPLRSNCTILSSLVEAQKSTELGNKIADIPFKLVRMITQARGNRNHWENTQENVFCLNSLVDYSGFYEPKAPMYSVDVTFDNQRMGSKQFSSKQDALETLSRPIQDGDAGKRAQIELHKKGEGRLYYSARVSYDLKEDNRSRINSGIEVRREYSVERNGEWTILQSPMKLKRGELVRVDLFVSVPATRHFVVVNDPLPGGLEPVNQDLATASTIDANKGKYTGVKGSWWYSISDWNYYGNYYSGFYHRELRHDSTRFYSDYLTPGNHVLSYTAQAIAEGDFSVMPLHVEEMYDPDVYGKGLAARLNVDEAD